MTLAHELTHVKQMALGELKHDHEGIIWTPRRLKEHVEYEADYYFCPWEIESRGYEQALYDSYMEATTKK